jgi:hypothetical protein
MSKLRMPVAVQIDEYLEANPDEELTVADVVTKFGVSHVSVYKAIERLGQLGKVEYARVIRRPAKGRASNGWGSPGPGRNGVPGGCDVEVTSFEVTGP